MSAITLNIGSEYQRRVLFRALGTALERTRALLTEAEARSMQSVSALTRQYNALDELHMALAAESERFDLV